MPTTPLGVWTPDDADDWDLTVDLAAMGASIDTAIGTATSRIIGTEAQRLALTPPRLKNGLEFHATDTKFDWFYSDSTWTRAPSPGGLFLAERQAAQTLAVNWNVVTTAWGAPVINELGTWNAGALTLAVSGIYRVSLAMGTGNVSNPGSMQLTKNSTNPNGATNFLNFLQNGGTNAMSAAGTFPLVAGDVIRTLIYSSTAGNVIDTEGGGKRGANWSMELIRRTL